MANSPSILTLGAILLVLSSLNNLVNCKSSNPDTFPPLFLCTSGGNVSISYKNNINILLSNFTLQSSQKGFYNTSIGDNPDKVFGYYMCRGDLDPRACHDCIAERFNTNQRPDCKSFDAVFYSDECIFRYSNHSMYGKWENYSSTFYTIQGNMPNNKQYNQTLLSTIKAVISEAAFARNGSVLGFATKEARVEGSDEMIYSLAQCTPDIVGVNCSRCLTDSFSVFQPYIGRHQGLHLFEAQCILQYNSQPFYASKAGGLRTPNMVAIYSVLALLLYYMLSMY